MENEKEFLLTKKQKTIKLLVVLVLLPLFVLFPVVHLYNHYEFYKQCDANVNLICISVFVFSILSWYATYLIIGIISGYIRITEY